MRAAAAAYVGADAELPTFFPAFFFCRCRGIHGADTELPPFFGPFGAFVFTLCWTFFDAGVTYVLQALSFA